MLVPLLRVGRGCCRCGLCDAAVSVRTVAYWLVLRLAGRRPAGPSRAWVVRAGGRSTAPVVEGTVAWGQAGACNPESVASAIAEIGRPPKMLVSHVLLNML